MRHRLFITTVVILWIAGCSHIGPQTLPCDRFDDNTAIADSWKEQNLLNIVKLRYADMIIRIVVDAINGLRSRRAAGTDQRMVDLATQIDVPPEHVADGRTIPSLPPPKGADAVMGQLIRVRSAADKPENAFTAVRYEDHWFWIDKRDFRSTRTFAFLMILFSLTETEGKEGLPLVTIPAG